MTIDEAIKTLEANELVYRLAGDILGADAAKLGIEALKAVKYLRIIDYRVQAKQFQAKQLPGETKA